MVRLILSICCVVALLAAPVFAASLDDFTKAVKGNGKLGDDQRQEILSIVDQMKSDGESPADIVSESLMQMYPAFEDAMAALGDEETDAAIAQLEKLATQEDKFLQAESSYYIGRAQMMAERYELALPVWKDVLEKHAETTFRTAEALFFKGMSESQLLKRKDAIASLDKFIIDYEDAPERMQVAAWHELELLRSLKDGTLGDVQDRMEFSRRKLHIEDSGDETQEEQDRIIAMLEKLIEQAEQQEQQGGS